jgi:hypothetical protein
MQKKKEIIYYMDFAVEMKHAGIIKYIPLWIHLGEVPSQAKLR